MNKFFDRAKEGTEKAGRYIKEKKPKIYIIIGVIFIVLIMVATA